MLKGTQAEQIIAVLERIPIRKRNKVREVTMYMAANMIEAIRRCFDNDQRVIDRFHVQKLACDAVQEARIKYRWEAISCFRVTRNCIKPMNWLCALETSSPSDKVNDRLLNDCPSGTTMWKQRGLRLLKQCPAPSKAITYRY